MTMMLDAVLTTLPNGVRVLVSPRPHAATVSVGVFVRWGSAHESARSNGIGHVLEHMAFKGTLRRNAAALNLAAERLGAEVNAHTDKDHTAYYMRGLPGHEAELLQLLGEIVLEPTLPADELERERQVLLHEFTEDADDPLSTAFKLFDSACFGAHAWARPVIGTRRNIERFTRDELIAHRQAGYTAPNLIVAAAGPLDPALIVREAERAFGGMASGPQHVLERPTYRGDVRSRPMPGGGQAHLVLGGNAQARCDDDPVAQVAAAVLGEGMSSPLLQRVREERALAYHAASSADVLETSGQFVIEASTGPAQIIDTVDEIVTLLRRHADRVAPGDLQRAQRQLAVRAWLGHERPLRWMEDAALELFALGRCTPTAERTRRVDAVSVDAVCGQFQGLLAAPPSMAVAGSVPRGTRARVSELLHRRWC